MKALIRLFLQTFSVSCFFALEWSALASDPPSPTNDSIRIATYNVYNYFIMDRLVEGRWTFQYPKPEEEKEALRSAIREVQPDIIALQEMGDDPFLRELQNDLRNEGLFYPYRYVLEKEDEVRQLAFLSRYEPLRIKGHLDLDFAYRGDREKIKRGLLEVEFAAQPTNFSLYIVHLKSKWTEFPDDPQGALRRTREAEAVRNAILSRHDPGEVPFLILGDVNDLLNSAPLRRLLQRGSVSISEPLPAIDSNGFSWTHRWSRAALYSRIDYLLASPAMMPFYRQDSARIYDGPGWEVASDHRMVYADFSLSIVPLP